MQIPSVRAPAANVLLIDDHPIIHIVMRAVVQKICPRAQFHVASNLDDGLRKAEAHDQDLVLLDLGLPPFHGTEALVRFRSAFPTVPLIVLSCCDDAATINAALDVGVNGYIPKTSAATVLIAAIRLVMSGGTYIPVQARSAPTAAKAPFALSRALRPRLTPRQRQVLRLIREGYQNREIAAELHVSESTVKQHVYGLFNVLGVSSRTQAVACARRLYPD